MANPAAAPPVEISCAFAHTHAYMYVYIEHVCVCVCAFAVCQLLLQLAIFRLREQRKSSSRTNRLQPLSRACVPGPRFAQTFARIVHKYVFLSLSLCRLLCQCHCLYVDSAAAVRCWACKVAMLLQLNSQRSAGKKRRRRNS